MTPSLPVALAILAFFGEPALAASAPAAPDFEPMAVCSPDAYKGFNKAKSAAKEKTPEKVASMGKAFASVLDHVTGLTDQAAWSVDDTTALPANCRIGEPKIKEGVYAALSEVRREINEKAVSVLQGEERAEAEDLTAKERAVDALMGGEAKSAAEFKTKLAGLGLGRDTGGAAENPTRTQMLGRRYRGLSSQAESFAVMGGVLPGANIPDAVRAREAKSAAEAKKRADAAKGLSFGGDKTDDTPNAGAGNAASGGRAAPGTNTPRGGAQNAVIEEGTDVDAAPAKKGRRPRVDSRLENAIIEEGPDPDDDGPSVLTEAVKNSATKPLGGAVNPASSDDANSRDSRKIKAQDALKRFNASPGDDPRTRMEKKGARDLLQIGMGLLNLEN